MVFRIFLITKNTDHDEMLTWLHCGTLWAWRTKPIVARIEVTCTNARGAHSDRALFSYFLDGQKLWLKFWKKGVINHSFWQSKK